MLKFVYKSKGIPLASTTFPSFPLPSLLINHLFKPISLLCRHAVRWIALFRRAAVGIRVLTPTANCSKTITTYRRVFADLASASLFPTDWTVDLADVSRPLKVSREPSQTTHPSVHHCGVWSTVCHEVSVLLAVVGPPLPISIFSLDRLAIYAYVGKSCITFFG